jgi:TRAP-type C4-dicarboxylate transport system substrate-binding protein
VNKKLFDGLSPTDQQALREAAREAVAYERQLSAEEERRLPEQLRKKGMQVNVLTDAQLAAFRERVKPVYTMVEEYVGTENMKLMAAEVEKATKAR